LFVSTPDEDDYEPPIRPTTEKGLPPWLTTIITTTTTESGSGPGDGETISPRPTTLFPPDERICRSPECVRAGELINQWMNTSVDPCEDFYAFACGGWMAEMWNASMMEQLPTTHFTNLQKTIYTKIEGK